VFFFFFSNIFFLSLSLSPPLSPHRCKKCGNKDQLRFLEIEGSMICKGVNDETGCGYELINYKQHEGNFYRSFEGQNSSALLSLSLLYFPFFKLKNHQLFYFYY
jgi:hypothetical protein